LIDSSVLIAWEQKLIERSYHRRHCVDEGLYRHHSRRTQLSENSGIVVSTLVTEETDRVLL